MMTDTRQVTMNGSMVIDVRHEGKTTVIYIRIPRELAADIDGGCECDYCKAHPTETPKWDTLAVCDKVNDYAWTVHMPTTRK